uniref:DUF4220 domain-containing protein n=1 Tax=Quercus lobata TaxID=97700 RepID=A0A7N2M5R9_QUELO
MILPIPNFVKKLWYAWNLQSCSYGLYLLADWIAPVAIGLISKSEGVGCNKKDLMAFWALFLLLHLGGPDTLTSFALES